MTPEKKKRPSKAFVALMVLLLPALAAAAWYRYGHRLGPNRAKQAAAAHSERLGAELEAFGARLGAPLHIRILKADSLLEVWVETDGRFQRFRSYPICYFSGSPGPKTAEGDRQSPEGIYEVTASQLHPWSRYHLAFNLGYPNEVERRRGWTGSALMVHGECVSIGCYAMGDGVEEIYVLLEAALESGQGSVPVHAFPFRLTQEALAKHGDHPSVGFWQELQPFYEVLERNGVPARAKAGESKYVVR